ncbi:transport integral membrane protein [Longispora fulva]|uniref:Copper transport protein n=1 Tax=Longispora fulva TaxID=619741 RepID=A0A8J7GMN8_9ACTN|nr:copper resistance protein CopC [Longispora fulva]MBG6140605.1 copper transport protein [Longispora fulva]GIG57013.1 transport integral membrane protein [Longispora fulva]
MRKSALFIIALMAGLLLPAAPASAHAGLQRTDPPSGSIVAQAPRQVTLYFTEAVTPVPGQLRIIGPDGKRADRGEPSVGGSQVSIPLREGAGRGTYLVSYRIISDDSHPVSGGFAFSIEAPSTTAPGVLGGSGAEVDPVVSALLPISRYLGYVGLLLVVGPVLLMIGLWPTRLSRPGKLVWTGVGLLAGGTVLALYLQAPYVTGGALFGASGADLREVLSSRFGFTGLARLAVLAAAVPLLRRVLAAKNTKSDQIILGVLGTVAALTWPLAGHPSASPAPPLTVAVDLVHLVAMAVWLGGLVGLALHLLPRGTDGELRALMPVWSRWAGWAVTALVVAGVAQALIEVGTLPALFNTRYGQLLIVKAVLLAGVLGMASVARRKVLTGEPKVRRMVFGELAVTAVILAVTAFLVQQTPARTEAALPSASANLPFSATMNNSLFKLQVELDPAAVGNNTMHMYAFTPDGKPIKVLEWQVTVAMPSRDIAPIEVAVLQLTDDHAVGELTLPTPGTWELRFTLRVSDIDQATVSQTVQIK